MPDTINDLDQRAAHDFTLRAQEYLQLAHASATEALNAMHSLRQQRREAAGQELRGQTSGQDQDLLRAMLVFACAGTDAAMKALIRDALPALADHDAGVEQMLTSFTERMLSDGGAVSPKALARILSQKGDVRAGIIEAYIADLTGESLQSAEQLHKVCAAVGIDDANLRQRVNDLRPVFAARNEIIHELDLTADQARRRRRHRAIGSMVQWASDALEVAQMIVNSTSESLQRAGLGA